MLLPQRNHGMEDIGRRSTYYLEYDVARTFIEGVVGYGYEMDEIRRSTQQFMFVCHQKPMDGIS